MKVSFRPHELMYVVNTASVKVPNATIEIDKLIRYKQDIENEMSINPAGTKHLKIRHYLASLKIEAAQVYVQWWVNLKLEIRNEEKNRKKSN